MHPHAITRSLAGIAASLFLGSCLLSAQTADFTLSAASGATSVDPGNPYPYAVWVTPVQGFTGVVTFTVSGLPTGASGSFKTADPTGPLTKPAVSTNVRGGPAESSLTVSTASSTPAGAYTLTITATSGSLTHTTTVPLTVNTLLPVSLVTNSVTDSSGKTVQAKCDGSTNDADAINAWIQKATHGGTENAIVEFPAGKTCLSSSIHLASGVRLQLGAGTTLKAHSGIDAPETLGCTAHQDFGHSHFHNALIWGENLHDIAIQGSGTINGNGVLTTGTPGSGQGDKVLSLKESTNITLTGITITDGGHFGILANGNTNVSVSNVKILDSKNRDAFNLINSSQVVIDNSDIEGSDDAMVLKSDSALCSTKASSGIYVSNSHILSTQNNATQFGSETCGDFSNVFWANLDLTEAGKAGIGITSNDGAIIDGITYDNIQITNAADPIFMKVDNLGRCSGSPPPGAIKNISISNVNATVSETGSTGEFTCTINGMPGSAANHITNVAVTNTQYTAIGGHSGSDANITPPEADTGSNVWVPKSLGTRPAFGWYVRHADDITFTNDKVTFGKNDNRYAFVADDGTNITLNGFVFEVGSGSPDDLEFLSINGFHVGTGTVSTTGAKPRVHEVGSTPN